MIRSEKINLYQIQIAPESLWDTMNYIAYTEDVMFIQYENQDWDEKKQRLKLYSGQRIKMCDELL